MHGTGPAIDLYLQQHPSDSRQFVNVITFSNYLSTDFIKRCKEEMNGAAFRDQGSARLRVTTLVPGDHSFEGPHPNDDPNIPGSIPGVTFGNANHEFIPAETRRDNITQSEVDFITMTNLVHQCLHEVKLNVFQVALVPKIWEILAAGTSINLCSTREACQVKPAGSYPPHPTDSVDTLVCRFTASKAYDGHSDTRPLKPENYSEERPESAMQIMTHGLICPKEGQQVDENVRVGTIHHGIPTGNGTCMECKLLGCFSSTDYAFTDISNKSRAKIKLTGISHAHFQMPGSQGELFHYIQLAPRRQQVLDRLIFSMRRLMDTIEHRNRQYRERRVKLNVKPLSEQCQTGVLVRPADSSMISVGNLLQSSAGASGRGKQREKPLLEEGKAKKRRRLLEPELGRHANGYMKESEQIHRMKIIGAEVSHRAMITSQPVSKNLYELGVTPVYIFGDGGMNGIESIQGGPMAFKTDTGPTMALLKPGTQANPGLIDTLLAKLPNTKHTKKVLNRRLNILHIRRVGKNDVYLLQNIYIVFKESGTLIPFEIRLGGGAAKLSGSREMKSSHHGSHRLAWTHTAASSQVLTSDDRLCLEEMVAGQTVLQVFFNGLSLGTWYAARSETRPERDASVMSGIENRMGQKLKQLHEEFSEKSKAAQIPTVVDDQCRNEIMAQAAPCYRLVLEPLDPTILSRWEAEEAPVHNTIVLRDEDVELSPIYCNNQEVEKKFRPGGDYESWMKVLHHHPHPFPTLKLHKLKELRNIAETNAKESTKLRGCKTFGDMLARLDKQISDLDAEEGENENNSVATDRSKFQPSERYNLDQIMPIMLYASAKTRIVAQGQQCVTRENPDVIHPARELIDAMIPTYNGVDADGNDDQEADDGTEYQYSTADDSRLTQALGGVEILEDDIRLRAREEAEKARELEREERYNEEYTKHLVGSHAKVFLAKPTHPTLFHPMFEPTAALAAVATRSLDNEELGAVNENLSWKMRNGPRYITCEETKEGAWKVLFKSTLCALMSPASILQHYYGQHFGGNKNYDEASSELKANPDLLLPNPNDREVDDYVSTLEGYRWQSSRILHEIIADGRGDVFNSGEQFVRFMKKFSKEGMDMFHQALKDGEVCGEVTRTMVAFNLQKGFEGLGATLSQFQMQHIMRTIEVCIHDPFGRVENVRGSVGSKSAAECYSPLLSRVEGLVDKTSVEGLDEKTGFPAMLVCWLNKEARKGLESKDEQERENMRHWLLVNGLEMHQKLGCLVHTCGIKKRLDENDTEHLGCLLDTLIQFTLPSRNNNKTDNTPRLDKAKYFPIRFTSRPQKTLARELEIMIPLGSDHDLAMKAYKELALLNAFKLDGGLLQVDVRGAGE